LLPATRCTPPPFGKAQQYGQLNPHLGRERFKVVKPKVDIGLGLKYKD